MATFVLQRMSPFLCRFKSMNIPSECRTASIGPNHAMILPRNANPNPDGIFGKDTVALTPGRHSTPKQ
jgi:hypothetical protein